MPLLRTTFAVAILFGLAAASGAAVPSRPSDMTGGGISTQHDDLVQKVQYRTPGRGSPERAALMDAARGPVSDALGRTVIFVVTTLRSDRDWAYLDATPTNPDGSPIDWTDTPFAEAYTSGMLEGNVLVLMRKDGGRWSTVDYVVGPTDVYWLNWVDQYGLPERLFQN